jgi:LmbE family N-acetylglucosaminyl deacetylase
MISLLDIRKIKRVLCLGAHCDDIEIGAGGTVMRLIAESAGIELDWVVFGGGNPVRVLEARRAAMLFTQGAKRVNVTIHGFRDSFFPYEGAKVKEAFEQLKQSCSPDLILTHHDDDRHQDHRLISELTWNTWRNNMILEYEILKWDGDLGRPNVFVPLEETACRRKAGYLIEAFTSQRSRQWFSEDVFQALARLRGVECNAPSGYAEAFYARKLVL